LTPLPEAVAAADAILRPVKTGNAFEEAVERILQAIKLGVVGDGERLPPERELAARLNVSRVTLREAIRALQDAGYVVSRRGRYGGTFVSCRPLTLPAKRRRRPAPPGGSLEDALAFRRVVEPGAAELAAGQSLSSRERAQLLCYLDESSAAGLGSYRQSDSRLHLAIAELAGSASLLRAVADVRVRVNDFLDAIPLLEPNLAHANCQHKTIVESILAGDPGGAREAMLDHLEGTAALLRGFLG
jgi:DNA-binding FadR family transcriptional regulator